MSAILYHLCTNFFGEIFVSIGVRIQLIRVILLAVIALIITIRYGYKTLSIKDKKERILTDNQ